MTNLDFVGIIIALVAAFATWLRVQGESKNILAGLAILSISCLTLLAGIRFEQIPKIEEGMRERTTQLEENLSINSKYVNEPFAKNVVVEYAKASEVVSQAPTSPFFAEYFSKRRDDYLDVLKDAQKGQYRILKEEIPVFANRVIEKATKSVIATSFVTPLEWWDEPWGRKYELMNYEKAKAGIKITRFFLFSDTDELTRSRGLLERHVDNNIDVYIVFRNDISEQYWNDIIIIDEMIGGELLLTPDKEIREVVMYTQGNDLKRLFDSIAGIKVRATSAKQYLSDPNSLRPKGN